MESSYESQIRELKEQIRKLKSKNDDVLKIKELKEQIRELKSQNEEYILERERALIERDKMELSLQKSFLTVDIVDYDNKMLAYENRLLSQKVTYTKENELEKIQTRTGASAFGCGAGVVNSTEGGQCVIF